MQASASSLSTPISSAVTAASFSRGMKQWPLPVLCTSSNRTAAVMRLRLLPPTPSSRAMASASRKLPPIRALQSR